MSTLLLLDGCCGRSPFEVTLTVSKSRPSRVLSARIGAELLDTVAAPAAGMSYASPPTLTGSSVAFEDVACSVPSQTSCDQVFRFKSVAAGQTIVTYHGLGGVQTLTDVVDTVVVH